MVQPTTHSHAGEAFPMAGHFPPGTEKLSGGALKLYPQKQVYEGISKDEQVVLVLRKHWIALLPAMAGGIALFLVPLIGLGVLLFAPLPETATRFVIVFTWFTLTYVVYYFLSVVLRYMTDIWVVSNERIIDMDTNTIALKSAREVDLLAVAAVEHERGGGMFFGGLNRGTVEVRVIGEDDYQIPFCPMPAQVAQVVRELVEAAQRERGSGQATAMARV